MELYTCDSGKIRFDSGLKFWAWIDDSLPEGIHKLSVNINDKKVVKDDDGLYVIYPGTQFDWI